MSEEIDNNISSSEYKAEICSITQDECYFYNCQRCETAKEYLEEEKKEKIDQEKEWYTNFERTGHLKNLEFKINLLNVIAKTNTDSIRIFQQIYPLKPINYHPDNLKQYAKELFKLRKYNNLGIPDEILAAKDYPAAFRYGDVWYLIAPKLEEL